MLRFKENDDDIDWSQPTPKPLRRVGVIQTADAEINNSSSNSSSTETAPVLVELTKKKQTPKPTAITIATPTHSAHQQHQKRSKVGNSAAALVAAGNSVLSKRGNASSRSSVAVKPPFRPASSTVSVFASATASFSPFARPKTPNAIPPSKLSCLLPDISKQTIPTLSHSISPIPSNLSTTPSSDSCNIISPCALADPLAIVNYYCDEDVEFTVASIDHRIERDAEPNMEYESLTVNLANTDINTQDSREFQAATVIQTWIRRIQRKQERWKQQEKEDEIKMQMGAATRIQAWYRGNRIRRFNAAVICVQSQIRMILAIARYQHTERAAIVIQSMWKMVLARRELKSKKLAKLNFMKEQIQAKKQLLLERKRSLDDIDEDENTIVACTPSPNSKHGGMKKLALQLSLKRLKLPITDTDEILIPASPPPESLQSAKLAQIIPPVSSSTFAASLSKSTLISSSSTRTISKLKPPSKSTQQVATSDTPSTAGFSFLTHQRRSSRGLSTLPVLASKPVLKQQQSAGPPSSKPFKSLANTTIAPTIFCPLDTLSPAKLKMLTEKNTGINGELTRVVLQVEVVQMDIERPTSPEPGNRNEKDEDFGEDSGEFEVKDCVKTRRIRWNPKLVHFQGEDSPEESNDEVQMSKSPPLSLLATLSVPLTPRLKKTQQLFNDSIPTSLTARSTREIISVKRFQYLDDPIVDLVEEDLALSPPKSKGKTKPKTKMNIGVKGGGVGKVKAVSAVAIAAASAWKSSANNTGSSGAARVLLGASVQNVVQKKAQRVAK
ncbi:hypothetical protein HK100_008959 [Physocladia obscura]|uniref:Uncharacterized protein n=1 Tax=Physocladia obscura TaxID=109957 RepID=A0AAD5T3L3_9FUNG|nr:hypothetical protein HK100_008959 [Physocladia obscura]